VHLLGVGRLADPLHLSAQLTGYAADVAGQRGQDAVVQPVHHAESALAHGYIIRCATVTPASWARPRIPPGRATVSAVRDNVPSAVPVDAANSSAAWVPRMINWWAADWSWPVRFTPSP
jgi:hypothetical protein